MTEPQSFPDLLREIRACRFCEPYLPLGANPIVRGSATARILIVGQAPSTKGHLSGVPWNDVSGDRLRDWLDFDRDTFYDDRLIANASMGMCYPGVGKSGDLPPRPECAPLWRDRLHAGLPELKLVLLIGVYAQRYYLGSAAKKSVTETVQAFREYGPRYLPLVHPSPRNKRWHQVNPWFAEEVVPELRARVHRLLA